MDNRAGSDPHCSEPASRMVQASAMVAAFAAGVVCTGAVLHLAMAGSFTTEDRRPDLASTASAGSTLLGLAANDGASADSRLTILPSTPPMTMAQGNRPRVPSAAPVSSAPVSAASAPVSSAPVQANARKTCSDAGVPPSLTLGADRRARGASDGDPANPPAQLGIPTETASPASPAGPTCSLDLVGAFDSHKDGEPQPGAGTFVAGPDGATGGSDHSPQAIRVIAIGRQPDAPVNARPSAWLPERFRRSTADAPVPGDRSATTFRGGMIVGPDGHRAVASIPASIPAATGAQAARQPDAAASSGDVASAPAAGTRLDRIRTAREAQRRAARRIAADRRMIGQRQARGEPDASRPRALRSVHAHHGGAPVYDGEGRIIGQQALW